MGCPASFRAMRSTDWIAWKFVSISSVAAYGSPGISGFRHSWNLTIFCGMAVCLARAENLLPLVGFAAAILG